MTKDDYVGAHALVLGAIRYYASTLRSISRSNTLHHDCCSRAAADALAYYEYGEVNSIACYQNHTDANTEYGLSLIKTGTITVMIFGSNGETLANYDSLHYPFLTDWYWMITDSARQKVTELMKAGNWQGDYWYIFLYGDDVWPILFNRYYGTGEHAYHDD